MTKLSSGEIATKDQGKDSHEFDKNIKTWPTCVFERVSHCVTNNSSLMNLCAFLHNLPLILHHACFNIFLGIVPSTSCV